MLTEAQVRAMSEEAKVVAILGFQKSEDSSFGDSERSIRGSGQICVDGIG